LLSGWWCLAPVSSGKIVSERLGYSSVTITLDTYSHAIPGLQRDAAERVAALIPGLVP
jgi:hypothetical protein